MKVKEQRFETVSDIQWEPQSVFNSIKENDFYGAFEAWKKRWNSCMRSQGDYFEADAIEIKFSQHFFFDLVQELSDIIAGVTDSVIK
jgi:hypothetical protein